MDIQKYVAYLREISRKIIANSDFNRALSESRKDYVYTIDSNGDFTDFEHHENSRIRFKKLHNLLETNSEKGLFIGIGLVKYEHVKNAQDERKITDSKEKHKATTEKNSKKDVQYSKKAPLLYAECEIVENNNHQFEPKIVWDTLCLNNDLLATLLNRNCPAIEEAEEINLENIANYQIIEDVRKEIESFLESINGQSDSNIERCTALALKCISKLKELDAISEPTHIKYEDKCHYFTRRIPDQLSTYEALQTLYEEINLNTCQNDSLNKILSRAIGDQVTLKYDDIEAKKAIECINRYIPYSLSENQKKSVENAFAQQCSYIQGPPGTGKSFTIATIILCSIFMGKSVLVVSQKRPALKVIEDIVNRFLDEWGVLYFDSSSKESLKNKLDEFQRSAYFDDNVSWNTHLQTSQKEQTLDESLASQRKDLEELTKYLNCQEICLAKHQEFLKEKKRFEKDIGTSFPLNTNFKFKGNIELLRKFKLVSALYRDSPRSILNTVIGKKLLSTIKTYIPSEVFKAASIRYNYLEFFHKAANLLECFHDYDSASRTLNHNPQNLRDRISTQEQDINDTKIALIKLKYKNNKYEYLHKFKKDIKENFIGFFKSILHYRTAKNIAEKQSNFGMRYMTNTCATELAGMNGYDKLLKIFPFWAAEVRDIGRLFPMTTELFDLVIVDEASQVNLAEIFPVFYRGKKFVIAGDHQQLGLNATGVNFAITKQFDIVSWNHIFGNQFDYNTFAVGNKLSVTQSSILDFIRVDEGSSIPRIMLDEHWRSLPGLATFTNMFYSDKLKIMTETGEKTSLPVFSAVKVNGKRNDEKVILAEAEKVIDIIKKISLQASYYKNNASIASEHEIKLPKHVLQSKCTIGVISMIRNQCDEISKRIENLAVDEYSSHDIMVGTPEEFQGHERDIMIISACLDNDCKGVSFFKNPNRFNVATSRAKLYTILVYSAIPVNFELFRKYMTHFLGEINPDDFISPEYFTKIAKFSPMQWKFNSECLESEFERKVYECLTDFIKTRVSNNLKIFNQVIACGQKRLDFVVYNADNSKCVAIEVDGAYHFANNRGTYSDDHIERICILKRAGWNIINTPYHKWYRNGWLCASDNLNFKSEIKRIYDELSYYLGINVTAGEVLQ